jgi:hypothetical protein
MIKSSHPAFRPLLVRVDDTSKSHLWGTMDVGDTPNAIINSVAARPIEMMMDGDRGSPRLSLVHSNALFQAALHVVCLLAGSHPALHHLKPLEVYHFHRLSKFDPSSVSSGFSNVFAVLYISPPPHSCTRTITTRHYSKPTQTGRHHVPSSQETCIRSAESNAANHHPPIQLSRG